MLVADCLFQMLIEPICIGLETVYGISLGLLGTPGACILPLSLVVNFLLLPFYQRADELQREEMAIQQRMAPNVAHIKKTFSGDERHMMLQAYYRLQGYKPIYSLRSALALFLQIPFFLAAYRLLSNLPDFQQVSYLFLSDLGAPDGLLDLLGMSINLLPILMTLVNMLSSEIYAKGLSLVEHLKLHGMALIFLALLYNSPSGLVLYWTFNNLFSLGKNIVSSSRDISSAKRNALLLIGALILAHTAVTDTASLQARLLFSVIGLLVMIPSALHRLKIDGKCNLFESALTRLGDAGDAQLFLLGTIALALLAGALIPSSVIMSSPAEFVTPMKYQTPLMYVLSTELIAIGTFVIWLGLFYYLSQNKTRSLISMLVWVVVGVSIANYMLFGTELGTLSSQLRFENDLRFSTMELVINAEFVLLLFVSLLLIWVRRRNAVKVLYLALIPTLVFMSFLNVSTINNAMPKVRQSVDSAMGERASFTLSRKGKNVVVLMMDRAIGSYIPYLFKENPELVEQFAGFTWYPNTLSFGTRTNTGSPALFGGYEYTPEKMNERSSELLESKQNEALKVMPTLFDKAGYDVTVCDPPYAGYSWIPDLSVFDDMPGVTTFDTEQGQFNSESVALAEKKTRLWKRSFFCYSIMKMAPLLFQPLLYQNGLYFNPESYDLILSQVQIGFDASKSIGSRDDFLNSYSVLCNLPKMTHVVSKETNTFLMMSNSTTHNPMLLTEPDYEPAMIVDNSDFDSANQNRFINMDTTLRMNSYYQMSHYHANMAALCKLGEWFDFLRSEGVYNNTRIIIVADHGWSLEQLDSMVFGSVSDNTFYNSEDAMAYNPLLMVKDFDCVHFSTDYSFMTNADTPSIALNGIVSAPTNPFTGNSIDSSAKDEPEQHVFYTDFWTTDQNNGTTFLPGIWFSVSNHNLLDKNNWKKLGEW